MTPNDRITPVILSGGSGTRLWPMSTDDNPKQFLDLVGPLSMFQLTVERCQDDELFSPPIIVGSAGHADLAEQHMKEMGVTPQAHILEPCARNTAPAIALAALACEDPQTPILVMPSDHLIKDVKQFKNAVKKSLSLAKARWLVTFGIKPTGPETGYGYIQQGEEIFGSEESYATQEFVEKPNPENAEKMLSTGGYHWNAGIFLFRADCYLSALEEHAPEILNATRQAMSNTRRDGIRIKPEKNSFAETPSDSIDYAIMENADKVAVTPMSPGWSDVGSWDSLFEISEKNEQQNVVTGDVTSVDASGNMIYADELDISILGLEDIIVVAKGKKLLILPRGQSQNVKKILFARNDKD